MTRALILVAALTAACGGPGEVTPDAGSEAADARAGMGGLVFQFIAPELDEPLDEVTITRIRAALVDLRAIGDTAPSTETHRPDAKLDLDRPDKVLEVKFDAAPPGLYSAFEFGIERATDAEAAWSLEGTCDIDGDRFDIEAEDEETSQISLPLGLLDLGAGETVEVTIVIGIALLVESIDWADAPVESGDTLVIDDDAPAMLADLRLGLISSIYVESITPIE